ncbi:MAG: hypothetical protein HPY69_04070 [Armatimonadetes bacterium]|nr:hypothetical protein [Armatimonadota bacterium]
MTALCPELRLSWRVGYHNYNTPEALNTLVSFLGQYRSVVDEVCFFDTITHHLYLPWDELQDTASLIGRAMAAMRDLGVPSVGINVLCTVGHIDEAWDYVHPLPFQPMVGHDGSVARGSGCPNDPALRQYVWDKYQLMARQGPHFIWVDDDIRANHHTVAWPCFCPLCLDLFARDTGQSFTREALVAALSLPDRGDLREAWIEQNVRSYETLLAHVRAAIDSVDPQIETGLMTAGPAGTTYGGFRHDRWLTALRATKSRPGGGFYTDATITALYGKSLDVGWQRSVLPEGVRESVYELENFPYQVLKKSVSSVMNEATLALAQGLTGVAFNALGMWNAPLDDKRPLMKAIAHHRPLWEQVAGWAPNVPTRGLWIAWTPGLMARRRVLAGEDWFAPSDAHSFSKAAVLGEIGLPLAVDPPGEVTVLVGRVVEAFADDELRQMLSGGVLMDAAAAQALADRGLGDLTGVRLAQGYNNGVVERFSADPLNGDSADQIRDARIEFFSQGREHAWVLEPLTPSGRVLAQVESYWGQVLGPCLTAAENELGGRVAVMGYAPWMFLHSTDKRAQLQNLTDWLSRGTLPVRVQQAVPVIPVARLVADRTRGVVTLFNSGLDWLPEVTVEVRAPRVPVCELRPGCRQEAAVESVAGGWQVRLRDLPPWSTVVLLIGSDI